MTIEEASAQLETKVKVVLDHYKSELGAAYRLQSATRFDRANRIFDDAIEDVVSAIRDLVLTVLDEADQAFDAVSFKQVDENMAALRIRAKELGGTIHAQS